VSFKTVKNVAAGVVVGGILLIASAGHFGWMGLGDPDPAPIEARLLTEGMVGGQPWAVVLVRSAKGEAPHLRSRGVDVEVGALQTEQVIDRPRARVVPGEYKIEVVTLPGTSQPMVFGLLPIGAVRAEVVPDTVTGAAIPVEIRAGDGTAVPYVIAPAPGSPATWEGRSSVIIRVYNDESRQLLPARPK
jgi:hypothetical protein